MYLYYLINVYTSKFYQNKAAFSVQLDCSTKKLKIKTKQTQYLFFVSVFVSMMRHCPDSDSRLVISKVICSSGSIALSQRQIYHGDFSSAEIPLFTLHKGWSVLLRKCNLGLVFGFAFPVSAVNDNDLVFYLFPFYSHTHKKTNTKRKCI